MMFKEIVKEKSEEKTIGGIRKRAERVPEQKQIDLVRLWQESRFSRKKFCRRHNINPTTFAGWIKKLNTQRKIASLRTQSPSNIAAENSRLLEIHFPNGAVVHFQGHLETGVVLSIIQRALTCKFN